MNHYAIDPAALVVIERTPQVLRALLGDLPSELLHTPNADGWSLKDIVAHLHDVESVAFTERIDRMLAQDRPFIESIDPPARLLSGGYANRDLPLLVDELQLLRSQHIAWLTRLTPEDLARDGKHDTVGEIRVVDIAHQWAAHDMAHLRQMALMIQHYFAPKMGATRGFYDV